MYMTLGLRREIRAKGTDWGDIRVHVQRKEIEEQNHGQILGDTDS